MLDKLMKKGIQFGFYDIQKAINMYLNPALYTYGDEFLFSVLTYMANQKGFNLINEEPTNFNEDNPHYINPLDLVIKSVYSHSSGYDIIATNPKLYQKLISTFGKKGLRATPYDWRISNDSSSGTISLFMHIIGIKIGQEIKQRDPYEYIPDAERYAEVYTDWNTEAIIDSFKILSDYDALYHSKDDSINSPTNIAYPPDFLFNEIIHIYQQSWDPKLWLPYDDLFEPYYPVFEWLAKNGYLSFGIKEYLVFKDGLSINDFFTSYNRRIEAIITIPNDRYAQYGITMNAVESLAKNNSTFSNYILPEAREIIEGKRTGFSDEVRSLLLSNGFSTNLLY